MTGRRVRGRGDGFGDRAQQTAGGTRSGERGDCRGGSLEGARVDAAFGGPDVDEPEGGESGAKRLPPGGRCHVGISDPAQRSDERPVPDHRYGERLAVIGGATTGFTGLEYGSTQWVR